MRAEECRKARSLPRPGSQYSSIRSSCCPLAATCIEGWSAALGSNVKSGGPRARKPAQLGRFSGGRGYVGRGFQSKDGL